MGMEVAGSEVPQVNGEGKTKLHEKENGEVNVSEPIKFGSHGVDESKGKGETRHVANANLPKDAVDEWPADPQVHSFWFVKYRLFEDPSLKAKIEKTDKEILKANQRRSQIIEELKPKRATRSELIAELKSLGAENSQYWEVINEKRQEMKPLQDALGTLRGSGRERGGICSTEEELNELIRSLEYQMQHESLSLKEEKQLVREIKELEATRPKVIANAARRAKIQDSLGQTEVIQDQVKLLGTDLEGVKKQKAEVRARMDHLSRQVRAIDDQIKPLQDEYVALGKKRDEAVETIKQLRKDRDEVNGYFFENRNVLNSARGLAAKKDVKTLNELVHSELEKFVSHWNSSKAFRDDYQKRILASLDMRQLSRDGRMRNPDEKPLVMAETPRPPTEVAPKTTPKPQKEDAKKPANEENLPTQKALKESKKNSKESKAAAEQAIDEDIFVVEKPKEHVAKENEIDEATLKEKRREEEKEKQRQALERKKKQQEKAAAKAALRAQKEAEKKQKDREKKLKKKEASSIPSADDEEAKEKEAEAAETEKSDNVEDIEASGFTKPKEQQRDINTLKFRKPVKTRSTLPKVILKKKRSPNYWIWGSAAAAMMVLVVLLAIAYTRLV